VKIFSSLRCRVSKSNNYNLNLLSNNYNNNYDNNFNQYYRKSSSSSSGSSSSISSTSSSSSSSNNNHKIKVIVAGATGYIGRKVVEELVSRNIPCISLVRSLDNISMKTMNCLDGSKIMVCNVLDHNEVHDIYDIYQPSITICCLASRSGVKKDSWSVDYGGGVNLLHAQRNISLSINEVGHYVLLSAFCCGKPLLQYQHAKLKLEEEIIQYSKQSSASPSSLLSSSPSSSSSSSSSQSLLTYSIVRPTAYFKSLDGQVESASKGNPLLYFGKGDCSANAIGDEDLAKYLVDCAIQPNVVNMINQCRDIGGPDNPPISKLEQLQLIYNSLEIPIEKRRYISLPIQVIDSLIGLFCMMESISRRLNLNRFEEKCSDASEIARIVRYYATEPMVAINEGDRWWDG
jgi:divinyl chlorophyllide a 8-vinyl-reductase